MPILITVVICTRNRARLLARALESVCRQSLEAGLYEVVVVDNGSADDTPHVVAGFTADRQNVRGMIETRLGLSHARNRGYVEARGEYVAYMDDDCRAPEGWLAAARGVIERCAPAVFGGPYFPCYDAPKPVWFRDAYASHDKGGPARFLGTDEFLSGGNIFIRKSLLAEMGGFDGVLGMSGPRIAYAEEMDLLRRFRETIPDALIYYDPGVFLYHLVRPEKMTMQWIVRQKFASGRDYQRALGPDGSPPTSRIALLRKAGGTVAALGAEVVRGLFRRDRGRYPDVRNYFCERSLFHLQILGMVWGRYRLRRARPHVDLLARTPGRDGGP